MIKKVILFGSVSILLFSFCSLSMAEEGKKLEVTLRDGKVSADIRNAPLKEVARQIGEKWGISVDLSEGVDQDRMISTQFQDLSPLNSLQRLLRGANFLYIEGARLRILGYGTQVANVHPVIEGPSGRTGAGSMSEAKARDQERSIWAGVISGAKEEKERANRVPRMRGPDGREGSPAAQGQNLTENTPKNERKVSETSFSTSLVLDGNGQVISGLSSDIAYDSNLLANPRVTLGDSGKQGGKEVVFNEVAPGLLRVGVIGLNQKAIPDGEVVQVTFDVLKEGQISLNNRPTATDPRGKIIPVTVKDGRIVAGK